MSATDAAVACVALVCMMVVLCSLTGARARRLEAEQLEEGDE